MEMFANIINLFHYFAVSDTSSVEGGKRGRGVMLIVLTAPLFLTICHLCSGTVAQSVGGL